MSETEQATFSDEEMQETAVRLLQQVNMPNGPLVGAETPQGTPAPEGVFGVAELRAFQLESVKHPMPKGKHVWVHQLAPESVSWLNRQAARRVAAIEDKTERALEQHFWAHAYQVIACCRVGPEPNAALVYTDADADLIRRNLPWEVQERIVKRCDALGGDDEALSEGLLAFFGSVQASLKICVSQLNTGSMAACRAGLERLSTSVSRIVQLKSLASDEVETLQES